MPESSLFEKLYRYKWKLSVGRVGLLLIGVEIAVEVAVKICKIVFSSHC
jgi:hypothetical protein